MIAISPDHIGFLAGDDIEYQVNGKRYVQQQDPQAACNETDTQKECRAADIHRIAAESESPDNKKGASNIISQQNRLRLQLIVYEVRSPRLNN